jgi:UDP-N-acetylglucosamine transferase subunit ALG13
MSDTGDRLTWVTSDSPQSSALRAGGESVISFRALRTRDYRALARSIVPAVRILRRERPDLVVSTGAGIALAFLPFAWLVGAKAMFVESATRTQGPSLTGRLLALLPWVSLRTQHASWSRRRWQYTGSVFDEWRGAPGAEPGRAVRRVFVTTGTQPGYPYVSLVEAMHRVVPPGVEVRYQLGPGFPVASRPPGAREFLSKQEFADCIAWADAVVAHAGVGSAMTVLRAGRMPVLCPRQVSRGEHVDGHQQLIADELQRRGLAVTVDASQLSWQHVLAAAAGSVRPAHALPESVPAEQRLSVAPEPAR